MRSFFSALAFCLLLGTTAFAQNHVWVFFEGKSLQGQPALSPEGLQRRAEQGIALSPRDWPVDAENLRCLEAAGCKITSTSRWLNAASVETTLSAEELRATCARVSGVQPVRSLVRHNVGDPIVSPSSSAKTAGSPYGFSETQLVLSGITCLHEAGFKGEGVKIAVFDAGFTTADTSRAFAAARAAGRITHTWDFVDNDADVYADSYHGLLILGTLTADLTGELMGSAPRATYMLARTETEYAEINAEETNWMSAVEWADSLGADVISSSLGYSEFDPGEINYTYADMNGNTTIISKAADIAASLGILVVNSAGNQGASAWRYITAPCDADSILCIGAVDAFSVQAAFSSYGPSSDGQVKPDIMAMGVDAATISPFGDVGFASGTSLSCPVASGMVACLIEKHPGRPMMDVLRAVQQSADRYMTPDSGYGYGIANGCKADSLLDILDMVEEGAVASAAVTVWPNPGSHELSVLAASPMQYLELMDVSGRVVTQLAMEGNYTSIDTRGLPAGLYVVRAVMANGQIVAAKWLKQ